MASDKTVKYHKAGDKEASQFIAAYGDRSRKERSILNIWSHVYMKM